MYHYSTQPRLDIRLQVDLILVKILVHTSQNKHTFKCPLFLKIVQFQAVFKKPSLLLTSHLIREQFSKPLFKSDILSESSISVGTKLEGRVIISFTFV